MMIFLSQQNHSSCTSVATLRVGNYEFLIDTGSEITVISEKVFMSLPCQLRGQFELRAHTFITANGTPTTAKGPVLYTLTIAIAGRSILEPICVMGGGPPGMLGMPALLPWVFT